MGTQDSGIEITIPEVVQIQDQDFIQEPPIRVEVEATGVTIEALNALLSANAENLPEKEVLDIPKNVRIRRTGDNIVSIDPELGCEIEYINDGGKKIR